MILISGIHCIYFIIIIYGFNPLKLRHSLLQEQEIPWTDDIIGVVDSSFFWGYIITQIPGGIIASRFPAHRLVSIIGAFWLSNQIMTGLIFQSFD